MKDVLFFNNMLTPKIITAVYCVLLLGAVLGGLGTIFSGKILIGLFGTVVGAVAARIWCELMIVLFKMNEALQDLRNKH